MIYNNDRDPNDEIWEKSHKEQYAVDIPQFFPDYEMEWQCIDYFPSREEALKFVQEKFGADENGCICLISKI
jgi:hypothetical protein